MALTNNQEVWISEVSKKLYEKNSFYTGTKNDSNLVDKFGKVNIPQMVTTPTGGTYVKGTTTLPLTPSALTSSILEYSTFKEYFDPMYIDGVDDAQYNFYMYEEGINSRVSFLLEKAETRMLHAWTVTATSSLISTTGSARTNKFANAAAKAITDADVVKANLLLNRQKVSPMGRRMVVSATGYNDLMGLTTLTGVNLFQPTYDNLINGQVGRYRGFDVYLTELMPSFTSANAKKAIGAVDANTDKEATLFFHPEFVRYGIANTMITFNQGGLYLTEKDIVTGWVWTGASPAYEAVSNSVTGIVTLIEG